MFDFLPLGAVINNRYFCVHGGLSPSVALFEDVCSLNRVQEIPHEGGFTDLM